MKKISIRLSDAEMLTLESYCTKMERTKVDVIRELIRKLQPFPDPPDSDEARQPCALAMIPLEENVIPLQSPPTFPCAI